jgi:DNA-directed RNA polymerase subunit RPC12/RpoP
MSNWVLRMFDSKNNNEMTMENKTIICIQCETEFEFTIHDQLRYEKMNFDEPRRCPNCRKNKSKTTDSQDIKRNRKRKLYQPKFEY